MEPRLCYRYALAQALRAYIVEYRKQLQFSKWRTKEINDKSDAVANVPDAKPKSLTISNIPSH